MLHFDDQDVLAVPEVITEPAELAGVLRYCQVCDAAVHVSLPYYELTVQLRAI